MEETAPSRSDARPEAVKEFNSRVWDLTLNLVHPAGLYVLLQMVIGDHMGKTPAFAGVELLHPQSLAIYAAQFLGAWTVFYTTLLRDMGYRSSWGTVLLLAALAGAATQYLIFPQPAQATDATTWAFLATQMGLAVVGWPLTMRRWRRLRRRHQSGTEHERAS